MDHLLGARSVRAGVVLAAPLARPVSLAGHPGPRPGPVSRENTPGCSVHAGGLRQPDLVRRAGRALRGRTRSVPACCLDIVHGLRHRPQRRDEHAERRGDPLSSLFRFGPGRETDHHHHRVRHRYLSAGSGISSGTLAADAGRHVEFGAARACLARHSGRRLAARGRRRVSVAGMHAARAAAVSPLRDSGACRASPLRSSGWRARICCARPAFCTCCCRRIWPSASGRSPASI